MRLTHGQRLTAFAISLALGICLLPEITLGADGRQPDGRPKLILDADTANEIDDLYAIIRTLRQEKFDVLGLNSAQWWHYLSGDKSVQASQKLNEDLVKLLGREDLPTPVGAEEPMGKPWGGEEPKDSPAAQLIIESALSMPAGEKLYVVCATRELKGSYRRWQESR